MKSLIVLLFLSSCARLSYLPPAPEVQQKIEKGALERPLNLEEVWYSLYHQGKKARTQKQYEKACEQFGRLIAYKDFPLIQLAELYHLESCSYTGGALSFSALEGLEENISSGLKPEFYEVAYNLWHRYGDLPARAKASLALARVRTLRADKEKFFKEAWELAPVGELKEEAAKELFSYAPRFNPNPKFDDFLTVARDFERAREFSEAKKWYQRILKENPDQDFDRWLIAANRYRQLFKNLRDKEGHLRETNRLKVRLESMLKKSRDDKRVNALAEMMIGEARAEWTENRRSAGMLILKRALEFLPSMSINNKALILWIRGMMELEAKDHTQAKILFREALELNPTDNKVKNDALWNLAWTYYLDREDDAFVKLTDETIDELGDEMRERLEFWKGKALYRQGKLDLALKTWEELYTRAPFNYYAMMAHASSGASFKPISASLDETAQSSEVEWLASLKEWDICRQYLDDWRLKRHLNSTKEKWLASFIRCRHSAGAIRVYFSHSKARDLEFMQEHLLALYPLSFKDVVFKAASRFKTDPYLLQSIIRQESAFNPEARSPADAFGLMQLIPELAQRLSKEHRVPYRDFNDLYKEDINVTLGSAYIRELLRRMDGRMVGVIAAYNAGTGPIFNWYKNRHRKDVFEFIEGIAYEETRNYIKLVLRNWIIYQQLERNSEFQLDLKQLH